MNGVEPPRLLLDGPHGRVLSDPALPLVPENCPLYDDTSVARRAQSYLERLVRCGRIHNPDVLRSMCDRFYELACESTRYLLRRVENDWILEYWLTDPGAQWPAHCFIDRSASSDEAFQLLDDILDIREATT